MFGQTQNSTLFGLLIFAATGAVMGAAGCTRHPESAFGDGRSPPCECSVVHESGLQAPPDERACAKPDECVCDECPKPDECAPYELTVCEPTVCDECPTCDECPECEPVECDESDIPDASCCDTTVGSYPVADDQVALTSMNLDIEWTCGAFSQPFRTFTSIEDDPVEFLLLPTPDMLYSVEVIPLTGSIALGYGEGDVVHDDETDIYTWYLARWSDDFGALGEENVPARLSVISLTPQSRFKVQLKRGE